MKGMRGHRAGGEDPDVGCSADQLCPGSVVKH
jgi:hypothetical protein